jgi:hypothetical protein
MNNLKLITQVQKLAFCLVSVAPIRAEGKDSSEIISQLLFGEPIEVILFGEPWLKVKTIHDGYEGFVDIKHVLPLTEKELKKWLNEFNFQCEILKTIQTPWGSQLTSIGSFLGQDHKFNIGAFEFSQNLIDSPNSKTLIQNALELINTPYLWGGKSTFGIDCSGFTQMIFRLHGYNLPRDAYQQADFGAEVDYEEVQAGDVAFFSNINGKIIHVGIVINENQIIHASGRVRIDELTKTGVFNHDYQKETHKLTFIKRII